MKSSTLGLAVMLMVGTAIGSGQETFDMKVERVRVLRKTRGDLHVDIHGVTFRSDDKKTEIQIPLANLRRVDVADPKARIYISRSCRCSGGGARAILRGSYGEARERALRGVQYFSDSGISSAEDHGDIWNA